MNPVKIIFFDIDGTLIDMKKKRISPKMLETLKRLQEKNILIAMATGRSPMILPTFEGVKFDVFLSYNGSYCFNNEKTIFSNSIPNEDIQTIIKNASRIGRPLSLATKNRLASNGKDEDLIEYYSFGGAQIEIADDFEEIAKREEIFQVLLGCRKEEYSSLMRGVQQAKIAAWWNRAVDIIPKIGGKGLGIQKVLDYYQIDRAEAMAFGDGNNDIEMLKAVGTGIAMKNASEQLKEIADEICGEVAEDGIYYYCLEKHLI